MWEWGGLQKVWVHYQKERSTFHTKLVTFWAAEIWASPFSSPFVKDPDEELRKMQIPALMLFKKKEPECEYLPHQGSKIRWQLYQPNENSPVFNLSSVSLSPTHTIVGRERYKRRELVKKWPYLSCCFFKSRLSSTFWSLGTLLHVQMDIKIEYLLHNSIGLVWDSENGFFSLVYLFPYFERERECEQRRET